MKITSIVSLVEALKLKEQKKVPRYFHDRLPADFITRAGRMYDRLKGIDDTVERISKEQWIDEFRMEAIPEAELAVFAQCLAAVSKLERKCGNLNQGQRKGAYYLGLTRSACHDSEEAFRLTEKLYGFKFIDCEKKPLM